jgi:1-aminocyclopropane-1-carboxylate deaminase
MATDALLTRLSDEPVLGVSMAGVSVLRLELTGGLAPGNKAFKLQGNLEQAQRRGIKRLVSFGGAWSNHLHALAAVGAQADVETIGMVRGDVSELDTAMLADARRWGMQLVPVSRSEYRQRNAADYLERLQQRFAPCLVIPEGGANGDGVRGCMAIAGLLDDHGLAATRHTYVLAVGTGTTLAGLAASLPTSSEVVGISALKGARDLEERVAQALLASGSASPPCKWEILHEFHCGGFARASEELRAFIRAFEAVHGIPLEPVYTGKALFAIYQLLKRGSWRADKPVVMIHTGGLQGRRGYAWLEARGCER